MYIKGSWFCKGRAGLLEDGLSFLRILCFAWKNGSLAIEKFCVRTRADKGFRVSWISFHCWWSASSDLVGTIVSLRQRYRFSRWLAMFFQKLLVYVSLPGWWGNIKSDARNTRRVYIQLPFWCTVIAGRKNWLWYKFQHIRDWELAFAIPAHKRNNWRVTLAIWKSIFEWYPSWVRYHLDRATGSQGQDRGFRRMKEWCLLFFTLPTQEIIRGRLDIGLLAWISHGAIPSLMPFLKRYGREGVSVGNNLDNSQNN